MHISLILLDSTSNTITNAYNFIIYHLNVNIKINNAEHIWLRSGQLLNWSFSNEVETEIR